jgi:hypothetical protein
MEVVRLEPLRAQQAAALAAYQQAFPWMQAPAFVDLSQEDEDDFAA